ncbi:helicase-associated domain-containing protein, partial [Actinomyces sp. 186855]
PEVPPADLADLPEEDAPVLPPASLAMLDALTWGPPAGTLRDGGQAPGAAPLIARGWLERTRDASGTTRFLLPRHVALALRGGRLLRRALTAPDPAALPVQDPSTTADQASRAAEETIRLVTGLLEEWGREGGPILRTGGVGVRALARTADALGLQSAPAARVIELAAGAGLLGLDEAGATWVPSTEAPHWRTTTLPERWAPLAAAWAVSVRAPWLAGTRGEDGALRAVLGDGVEAAWAGRLRRRVLLLLERLPEGAIADPAWVRDALTWARPRRPVPDGAVTGVLDEAESLGVTGGGALSRAGRVLARAVREEALLTSDGEADPRVLAALERALEEDLAVPVGVLLLQSDLTAIVPGRPEPDLAALLERASTVESRGSALTVRFTAESVRGALDAGWSADELRQALERWTPAPLPSTLTVLIEDVARHHGAVRVREVACVLRVPDPAAAAGLLAETRLRGLGLDEVAPGVLLATAPAGQVLRELRTAGLSPVLEDASGRLLLAGGAVGARRGGPAADPVRPGAATATRRRRPSSRDLAVLVGRLRAGERARRDSAVPAGAATDPVHALAVMRQAQASRSRLRLRLAGPDGVVQERRVRVLAVEAGRVRLADLDRETELTVAVHRVVSVEEG